ncbi:MAG: PDZ domain-containing protein, partial [Sulfobacillus sp.]
VFIGTDSQAIAKQYGLATGTGVIIAYVEPNSPAANGGLTTGEVITAVNGTPVSSASALKDIIDKQTVGVKVNITVNDQGKVLTKQVTLGQEPNGPITVPSNAGLGN